MQVHLDEIREQRPALLLAIHRVSATLNYLTTQVEARERAIADGEAEAAQEGGEKKRASAAAVGKGQPEAEEDEEVARTKAPITTATVTRTAWNWGAPGDEPITTPRAAATSPEAEVTYEIEPYQERLAAVEAVWAEVEAMTPKVARRLEPLVKRQRADLQVRG